MKKQPGNVPAATMTGPDLRAWRERWAYSQQALALELGVIPLTVSRWERGDREVPSMLTLALETLERRRAMELRTQADALLASLPRDAA